MAYDIYLYLISGGIRSGEALDRLVEGCNVERLRLFTSDRRSGHEYGWTSMNVGSTETLATTGNTHIQFDTNPTTVREMIREIDMVGVSGWIHDADSLLSITLSGNGDDLPVLRTVWSVTSSLWSASVYDEVSGFVDGDAHFGVVQH